MGARAERMPQSGYEHSQSLFLAQPGAKNEQILSQTGTLPVSATSAQPVAQLMKLSELDTAGLKAGESSTKPLRIFNGKNYHVTIYLNQSTYDKYSASLPKKNGQSDFGTLSDNQFEFDEFHITPGNEHSREHFFYNDQGTPLHRSIKTSTPSSDPNDPRWKEYNQIIAKLLGKDVYLIHKAFNQTFGGSRLPVNAQEESQRLSQTRFTPSALLRKQGAAQPSKPSTFPGKLAVEQAALLSQPKSSMEIASTTQPASKQEEITSTTQPVSLEENQPESAPPAPQPQFNFKGFSLNNPKKGSSNQTFSFGSSRLSPTNPVSSKERLPVSSQEEITSTTQPVSEQEVFSTQPISSEEKLPTSIPSAPQPQFNFKGFSLNVSKKGSANQTFSFGSSRLPPTRPASSEERQPISSQEEITSTTQPVSEQELVPARSSSEDQEIKAKKKRKIEEKNK